MKKITSENPISFKVSGVTTLEIDQDGCLANDSDAAVALDRLGSQITVEDITVEAAVADAKESVSGPTLPELKEKAKALGLRVSGTKDELTARIAEAEAKAVEAAVADAGDSVEETVVDGPVSDEDAAAEIAGQ